MEEFLRLADSVSGDVPQGGVAHAAPTRQVPSHAADDAADDTDTEGWDFRNI
jgi:hypothetical protein